MKQLKQDRRNKNQSLLYKLRSRPIVLALLVITVTGLTGLAMVLNTGAATYVVSMEAESGALAGNASVVNSDASGGSSVKFGGSLAILSQIPTNPVPTVETAIFNSPGDIADDSAIYANPTNPANSVVIADNKHSSTGGIGVFSMQGALLQFRQDGMIGNVDLRTGFTLGGRQIILVGGNNRTNDTLAFWEFNPTTRQLSAPIGVNTPTAVNNYGFCLYKNATSGKFYAIVLTESGAMEQYELFDSAGKVGATKVRTVAVGSQSEGCVGDDELGRLYVGQESTALWRYDAEPTGGSSRTQVGRAGDGNLTADIEGVSIAKGPNNTGYIVVSSQGSSRYGVYDRQSNAFMRTFSVGSNGSIDAVSDTDGLDITTQNCGPGFEKGVLVVHDGSNTGASTSNLKFIPLQ